MKGTVSLVTVYKWHPNFCCEGFFYGCIRFVIHVLEYNRIEYHNGATAVYGTALCFPLPISQFSCLFFLLLTASKNCCYHFQGLFVISRTFFSKYQDNSRTNCTCLEFQKFSRTKVIFQDISRSVRTLYSVHKFFS